MSQFGPHCVFIYERERKNKTGRRYPGLPYIVFCRALRSLVLCWTVYYVMSYRALRPVLELASCVAVHCGPRPVCPCIAVHCGPRPVWPCIAVHCGPRPVWPCIAVPVLSVRALRSPSCGGPCVPSVTRFVAGPLGGVGLPPLVCDGIDDPAVCCCRDRVPVVSLFFSRSSSVYLVALVVG